MLQLSGLAIANVGDQLPVTGFECGTLSGGEVPVGVGVPDRVEGRPPGQIPGGGDRSEQMRLDIVADVVVE